MSKMNQKEAVYSAVVNVLSNAGIVIEDGIDTGTMMTKELRGQVNVILFTGFQGGTIELEKQFSDSDLKSYCSGLQSNWLRKDKRLNGGIAYKAKNPGSNDAQLKALRALISTKTDASEIAELQMFVDKRISELSASKAKTIQAATVIYSDLPAELQAKYSA